ncbi:hypothetical protein AKJ09_03169 [Labilithrix luteola]|uniref:Uncharacterized protein n=1 Tax=Labilithrix luteola TaxID=1391654 RepID=A0A0K1PSI8_9BACT|nr:hypothetical protein [Labilithrix luteola]AKU96505.1 hypothetical protein AKJ09_03169 [Labilithrix luteola]
MVRTLELLKRGWPATLAVALSTGAARADGAVVTTDVVPAPKVELRYEVEKGIVGCLSEPEFLDAVRRRLPDEEPFAEGASILVTTRIARDGRWLHATITHRERVDQTPDAAATQDIVAGSAECSTLSAAAALTVSLTIERSRSLSLAAPPTTTPIPGPQEPSVAAPVGTVGPAPAEPRTSHPAKAAAPPPSAPPAPRTHTEVRTQAAFLVGVGILPHASTGTSFGLTARRGRFGVGLDAGAWLPATIESGAGHAGAQAWLLFLSGSACLHTAWLRTFVCAIGTAGDFRAAGTGRVVSRLSSSAYFAGGARLGTEVPIAGPFSLELHGSALFPVSRPLLRFGNESLWRAPLVGGEIGVGLRMSIL